MLLHRSIPGGHSTALIYLSCHLFRPVEAIVFPSPDVWVRTVVVITAVTTP